MRKLAPVILAALAVAAIATAQSNSKRGIELGAKRTPVFLNSQMDVDARNSGTCDGGRGVCFSGKGKVDYDFPALSGSQGTLTTVCTTSATGTALGCNFGDQVLLGVDQAVVAGLALTPYITAADSFAITACCDGITDGGSCNEPDASYTARCIR